MYPIWIIYVSFRAIAFSLFVEIKIGLSDPVAAAGKPADCRLYSFNIFVQKSKKILQKVIFFVCF